MSLETVKTLTGVDNEQIAAIYTMYEKRLFNRLEQSLLEVIEIPSELEYILTECTIARFNRIGSEGMESESMDGHTAKYVDKDLSDYDQVIQAYDGAQGPAGADGFGTEAQYNDIIARLEALEAAE